MKPRFVPDFSADMFAAVRAYAIRPYIFTVYSLGIRSLLVSFRFSPTIVGCIAYALHVSGNEMMAANIIPSLNGHVRRHGGRMRYAPTYLPFIR